MSAIPVPRVPVSLEAKANLVREELWFGDDDPRRTFEVAATSLSAALAQAVGIKPFPAVALKAMQLVQDPDVSIGRLAECIEGDPIIAARLLQVANSALYRPVRPYVSIEQAVMRLGLDAVVELVIGIATMEMMRDDTGFGERVRSHSVGVAAVARTIGMEMRFVGVGRAFLAALLHDIGKLFISQAEEFDYSTLPESAQKPDEVHLYERVRLGYDHAVLAAHVMHEWQFPTSLCRAVALHHQPHRAVEAGGELPTIVALIRAADLITDAMEKGVTQDEAGEVAQLVATSSMAPLLRLSADVIVAMWPKMNEARQEMAALMR